MIQFYNVRVSQLLLNASMTDVKDAAWKECLNWYLKNGYYFPNDPPVLQDSYPVDGGRNVMFTYRCDVEFVNREQFSLLEDA